MASTENLLVNSVVTANTTSPVLTLTNLTPTVLAYLNVSAASGTSPTLTVTLQDSPDGVNWYPVPSGAFTAVTAVGLSRLVVPAGTAVGSYLRAALTVGGTTPSFTTSLTVQIVD